MSNISDAVFNFQAAYSSTLKSFQEKWFNSSLHLSNAIASYLSNSNSFSAAFLAESNILLFLIEAFLSICNSENGKFKLEKYDYYFEQSMEQLQMNTGLAISLIRNELNALNEDGYIEKTRSGARSGCNRFRLNFDKLNEMFYYLSEDYIANMNNVFKDYKNDQEIKKQNRIQREKSNNEKWEKVNEILKNNPSTCNIEEMLGELGIEKDIAFAMLVIYRGTLTYRHKILRWSQAYYNTLFGEHSSYIIGPYSTKDFETLFASCNPDVGITSNNNSYAVNISIIYKRLLSRSNDFKGIIKNSNNDQLTDDYINKNHLEMI